MVQLQCMYIESHFNMFIDSASVNGIAMYPKDTSLIRPDDSTDLAVSPRV